MNTGMIVAVALDAHASPTATENATLTVALAGKGAGDDKCAQAVLDAMAAAMGV